MLKIAPLTKLILTLVISVWGLLLHTIPGLAILAFGQMAAVLLTGIMGKTYKAVLSLTVVALSMIGLQYVLGMELQVAIAGGIRMVVMTLPFVILLSTTRAQDLSAALVNQCHIPPEYAFMFTAALRFIPDFLAESKMVREAQACRGYAPQGNIVKRMVGYLAIVEPLVLKAVRRSETMSMSLELRGFGSSIRQHTFCSNAALALCDYIVLAGTVAVTTGLVLIRF